MKILFPSFVVLEKINPRAYKHSVRSARKINSYSTIHDVEQSKNVYCESLEDDEKKKICREEQLLISFIPSVMPAIPDVSFFVTTTL